MSGERRADDLEGVVLAAGSSFRAGTFKPGLLIDGKPMVERAVEGMLEVCTRVIVVGGHEYPRLRSLLNHLARVECVENPLYPLGMFTSVKAGLSRVRAVRCFLLPVDTPCVPASVYRSLAGVEATIVVPSCAGQRGHPILIHKKLLPLLLREPDSSSLRAFVRRTGFTTLEVDAQEILFDIDTAEDYDRLVKGRAGGGS